MRSEQPWRGYTVFLKGTEPEEPAEDSVVTVGRCTPDGQPGAAEEDPDRFC